MAGQMADRPQVGEQHPVLGERVELLEVDRIPEVVCSGYICPLVDPGSNSISSSGSKGASFYGEGTDKQPYFRPGSP